MIYIMPARSTYASSAPPMSHRNVRMSAGSACMPGSSVRRMYCVSIGKARSIPATRNAHTMSSTKMGRWGL